MALFQCNVYSECLLGNTNLIVLLPLPDCDDYTAGDLHGYGPGARFQTLYLLHGAYGDATDWLRKTRLEVYAQRARLAVVMASAGNSFYLDAAHGGAYAQFFERELPAIVENVFPLAQRREDRFIGGFSMGAYGALRIALRAPQRFGAAFGFSGAYDLAQIRRELQAQKQRLPASTASAPGRNCWKSRALRCKRDRHCRTCFSRAGRRTIHWA